MLRPLIFTLLLLGAGALPAADLVPGSTSPDGKYALAFVCPQWPPTDPPPTVWFVRLPEQTQVSAQLVPHQQPVIGWVRGKNGGRRWTYLDGEAGANQEDRMMMYDVLTSVAQDAIRGKVRGEGYRVVWSDDSRQVTVWVGAHKFHHASVYRLRRGRFYRHQDAHAYRPPD